MFITGVQPDRPADAFTSCAVGCRGFEGSRNGWAQTAAAVQVSAAESIGFRDNTFVNLGSIGLGIGNDANAHATGVGLGAHDVSVVGNTFTASAGGGVMVGGVRPDAHHPSDPRMVNSDIDISDNRFYASLLEYIDQDPIFASYVTKLTIAHNYITDAPYTGIGLGYGWGANDPGGSPEYLNRGLYDFQPIYETPTTSSDVRVVGNYVRNVVQTMFDAGCIYTLSAMPRSTIEENLCENSGQLGLYFDEGSRFLTASRNVFVNTAGQWAHANNQNGNHTGDLTLIDNYATNPAITGIANGSRGNVTRGNVTISAANPPIEASRVIYNAGPTGRYRGPADPNRPAGRRRLVSRPTQRRGGRQHHGHRDHPKRQRQNGVRPDRRRSPCRMAGSPCEPDLCHGHGSPPAPRRPSGGRSPRRRRSPPRSTAAAVTASVDFRAGQTLYELTRTLNVTAVNPLTSLASFGSVPSQFGEAGGSYAILTSGADIWEDGGGSFDEYGTIYRDGAVGRLVDRDREGHRDGQHQPVGQGRCGHPQRSHGRRNLVRVRRDGRDSGQRGRLPVGCQRKRLPRLVQRGQRCQGARMGAAGPHRQ